MGLQELVNLKEASNSRIMNTALLKVEISCQKEAPKMTLQEGLKKRTQSSENLKLLLGN